MFRWMAAGALLCFLTGDLQAAKKKPNPDDITQVLELPKDPPAVAMGETRRLVFYVSPLSAKGLLSQQARDALRAILKANGNMPVVHIRAFVGGSGDLRRVPQIVSEVLTEKKMALPSVSVVQVGGLGLEGAQVVLEAVSLAKKDVNPEGLGFVAGQTAATLNQAADAVRTKVAGMPVVRVSCYVSASGGLTEMAGAVASRFPGAAVDVVQTLRAPVRPEATCDAVTRGGPVAAEKLAFTGTRIAIGSDEKAATATLQRLDKDLAEAGAGQGSIVAMHIYPVVASIGEKARALVGATGALTVVPFEGTASLDGVFAVDAVAEVTKQPPAP